MIIGLTGKNCGGKDEVAKFLVSKKGFEHFSLSDMIREECKERGLSIERENLIAVGNELREEFGNGVLAERAISKFRLGYDFVVSSIRHPAEVQTLRTRRDFFFINVYSDENTRFDRMKKRKRPGDPKTFKAFKEMEEREARNTGSGQDLEGCIELADLNLVNDSTLEVLYKKVDKKLKEYRDKTLILRPSKDEYYLGIAKAVSERGTCLRRNFGAVIVKDDQIISTGYVGAPRGAANCIDLGSCVRQKANIPPGQRYELCRSVHAEMNAVIHASRKEMLGSVMYLYGEDRENNGALMDARPCKLCARMIINAGIDKVVCLTNKGIARYHVEDDFVKNEELDLTKIGSGY